MAKRFAEDAQGRLTDELELQPFYRLTVNAAALYEDALPFGDIVGKQFPSVTFDISEATKCLALQRPTAGVFHLMRVMEAALRAVARTLQDESVDPAKNPTWQRILGRFDAELAKPLADRTERWRADDPFFSGIAAHLRAVKDAWRNETMHVGAKYTDAEAWDIWNHVGSFMRHLATKIGE